MKLSLIIDLTYPGDAGDEARALKAAERVLGDQAEKAWAVIRNVALISSAGIEWMDGYEPSDDADDLARLWVDAETEAENAYFEGWAFRPKTGGLFLEMV